MGVRKDRSKKLLQGELTSLLIVETDRLTLDGLDIIGAECTAEKIVDYLENRGYLVEIPAK